MAKKQPAPSSKKSKQTEALIVSGTKSEVSVEERKFIERLRSQDPDERILALGRVTSELVKRVDRAERHPGERILDEAELISSEARPGEIRRIECDACGVLSVGASTFERAGERAVADGWMVGNKDFCPLHRQDIKRLPGEVASPRAPKKLSPLDQLLSVRLALLSSEYNRGRAPAAVLENASHTGHRTMLSDIARGDVLGFFERLHGLTTDHPESCPACFLEAGMPAQVWLHELLALVTAEDKR